MVDVYLWLYHIDLWDEFYSLLSPIKKDIVLNLGLCHDTQNKEVISSAEREFPNLQISYHPNAGADILPFINDFTNNSCKQDIFVKLHSKKSRLIKKIEWRKVLLHSLIGDSGNNFYTNINHFKTNKNIGLISHKQLLFSNQEGSNSNKIEEILEYYKIPKPCIKKRIFAAGTMFMGSSSLYNNILNSSSITYLNSLLKRETGYVTDIEQPKYSHSLERIFGYICSHYGYNIYHTRHKTIRILNTKSPSKKLHLSITHTGYVFLEENLTVSGRLLHKSDDSLTIIWHHLIDSHTRKYIKVTDNTYVGI
jgi:lipopolysaccharide biosynthesis protein